MRLRRKKGCRAKPNDSIFISRAFLRHLFQVREPLAVYLAVVHNLHFMETLMGAIRNAIGQGRFERLRVSWNEEKTRE